MWGGQHTSWGDPWRVVPPRQLENLSARFRKRQESPALSHSRHGPHFPASEGSYKKKNLQPALPWGFPFQPGIRPHPVDAVTLRTLLGKGSVLWAAPKGHGSQPLPSCWHPVRQGETPRARHCPSKTRARVLGSGVGWAQGFATHPPHPPACSQIWPLSQEHRVHPMRDGAPHAPPKSFLNSSSASQSGEGLLPTSFLCRFRAAELPQAPLLPHGHASRP